MSWLFTTEGRALLFVQTIGSIVTQNLSEVETVQHNGPIGWLKRIKWIRWIFSFYACTVNKWNIVNSALPISAKKRWNRQRGQNFTAFHVSFPQCCLGLYCAGRTCSERRVRTFRSEYTHRSTASPCARPFVSWCHRSLPSRRLSARSADPFSGISDIDIHVIMKTVR